MTSAHSYNNETDDDTGETEVSSQFLDDSQPVNQTHQSRVANFDDTEQPQQYDGYDKYDDTEQSETQNYSRDNGMNTNQNTSRAEFTTAFDIIDALQETLAQGKSSLFNSAEIKINRDDITQYCDELKKVLPVQLERASALMRESERRLEAAQQQSESVVRAASNNAEEIIAKANEQAEFLAGHQNVVALAEEKAREIIATAQSKAEKVTTGANEYSATMLGNLDQELDKLSRDVKGGLSILRSRQQEAASHLVTFDDEDDNA